MFLSPTDGAAEEIYALAAAHVVPAHMSQYAVTPGRLDNVVSLMGILEDPDGKDEDLKSLLKKGKEPCGETIMRKMGTSDDLWRQDWALIELIDSLKAVNGAWHPSCNLPTLYDEFEGTPRSSFTGDNGLVAQRDLVANMTVYKDGASTGSTAGRLGETSLDLWYDEMDKDDTPHLVARCHLLTVYRLGLKTFCGPGDSGSAVFSADQKRDGWVSAGHLVSSMTRNNSDDIGLMVPSSVVLGSIRTASGREWGLH